MSVPNKNKVMYSSTAEGSVVSHLGQPLYIQQAENGVLIFHSKGFHSLPLYFKRRRGLYVSEEGGGCLEFVNGVLVL